ncbi:MAG: D-cysteine desulfhydrase [Deltaproteobacteria bacterium]|jgi:D-cysteine desulfhydrase|nr:D-cysteine desulfhydrase [Deltaproteobacteria bacterium]
MTLSRRLAAFPRRGYVKSPTPIEHLPRLSRALDVGVEIFVKRDDLLPGCLGGNKTRKLDFAIAQALAEGADALVTSGAVQSNHCRLTLAWAIHEGLECHLVLEERVPRSYDPRGSGNNFLFNLLGADSVTVVPGGSPVSEKTAEIADRLRVSGRRPYVIPGGAADPLGALGYAACAQELVEQLDEIDYGFRHVTCATGSGGTQSGLVAGLAAAGSSLEVLGVNVRRPRREAQEELVAALADEVFRLLGGAGPLERRRTRCFEGFLGPGYSLPDEGTLEAVRLAARTEALLVDPVYTGKALAGLIGLAREGFFERGERVLFLHTGGFPALFSYLPAFPETAGPLSEAPAGPAAAR